MAPMSSTTMLCVLMSLSVGVAPPANQMISVTKVSMIWRFFLMWKKKATVRVRILTDLKRISLFTSLQCLLRRCLMLLDLCR